MSEQTKPNRVPCHMCKIGEARLVPAPEDAKTFPGIPRWRCGLCGSFWIPNDAEIKALGYKVPNAKARASWGSA